MGKKKIPWIIFIMLIVLWWIIASIFDIDIPSRWGIMYAEIAQMP